MKRTKQTRNPNAKKPLFSKYATKALLPLAAALVVKINRAATGSEALRLLNEVNAWPRRCEAWQAVNEAATLRIKALRDSTGVPHRVYETAATINPAYL